MGLTGAMPRSLRWVFLSAVLVLTVNQVHAIGWPGAHQGLWPKVAYDAGILAVSAVSLLRALRGEQRGPWLLVALGLTCWSLGDVYYTVFLWGADVVAFPSPADIGYQLMPPLVMAGALWRTHRRHGDRSRVLAADGVAAACAIAAVLAAVVVAPVLADPGGDLLVMVFTGSPPIEDTLLLALTIGILARSGWQLHRQAVLFVAGVLSFSLTDSAYLVMTLHGSYSSPSPIDTGWWVGLVLIALAAWQPVPRAHREGDDERNRMILAPLTFAAIALAVLIAASASQVPRLAVVLASASMLAVMARLTLTFRQNVRMLKASRSEARTDALTGLGNRRELARELERRLGSGEVEPFELVLFDLDGFKHYNDTYGHPAGDGLLQRLGQRLVEHVGHAGCAYRLGGDEFCALIAPSSEGAPSAARSLTESGDGFTIGASFGAAVLPVEADDAVEAMRIADQRLYAHKHGRRGSAGRQSADALLGALAAHRPEIVDHAHFVAELAECTARTLGLPHDDVELIRQVGELHDVGKLGVPTAILEKPGALDGEEWSFVRRHTIIGERIIGSAPALVAVARIVRATHERWDGAGYPDGLAGTEIPVAARVVAVADAFEAMIANRPYRPARTHDEALQELRRCGGTQFDAEIVEAFLAAWAERGRGVERAPAATA